MIPNNLSQRREMIKRILGAFTDEDRDNLTKWEFDFIESVNDWFDRTNNLTDRQCEILEKIYDKIQ